MDIQTRTKMLMPPSGRVDVVLDTDAYNEVDDQFAIAYLLRSADRLNTVAIYAAPFDNSRCQGAEDGMRKSYDEILHILDLCGENSYKSKVYEGSKTFLEDISKPVDSPAARDLAQRAMEYSSDAPLYVIAIGAITNIASALLLNPAIAERIVIIWLGGHAHHWAHTREFNMRQDYLSARIVMGSAAPFVQLPCSGVVSEFLTTIPELEYWLVGKNPLADYLARNTIAYAGDKSKIPWSKVIWDVTAVAWLLNDGEQFLHTRIVNVRLPHPDGYYEDEIADLPMCYVYGIRRNALFRDLFEKLLRTTAN